MDARTGRKPGEVCRSKGKCGTLFHRGRELCPGRARHAVNAQRGGCSVAIKSRGIVSQVQGAQRQDSRDLDQFAAGEVSSADDVSEGGRRQRCSNGRNHGGAKCASTGRDSGAAQVSGAMRPLPESWRSEAVARCGRRRNCRAGRFSSLVPRRYCATRRG